MLLRRAHLEGIRTGAITQVFRSWKRPTVKAGGTLATAIGQLAIDSIDVVAKASIRDDEARAAGYASREALRADLREGAGRTIYRIRLRLAGPDPRIALREADDLTAAEIEELDARLARFDAASRRGLWTTRTLELIRDRPATRAPDLAASEGWETPWFKTNVRKLKALGLTESLDVGYRLSPRGAAFMKRSRPTR